MRNVWCIDVLKQIERSEQKFLGSSRNLRVDWVIWGTTSLFMEWITRPGSLDTEKILSVLRRHLCCMIYCTKRRIQNIDFGEISTRELLQKMLLATQEHAQVHIVTRTRMSTCRVLERTRTRMTTDLVAMWAQVDGHLQVCIGWCGLWPGKVIPKEGYLPTTRHLSHWSRLVSKRWRSAQLDIPTFSVVLHPSFQSSIWKWLEKAIIFGRIWSLWKQSNKFPLGSSSQEEIERSKWLS